jgi:hypothetical protein
MALKKKKKKTRSKKKCQKKNWLSKIRDGPVLVSLLGVLLLNAEPLVGGLESKGGKGKENK